MLNVVDYVLNTKLYKKFAVDDLLFVQYQCMVTDAQIDYWTHLNYFCYILSGRKKYWCRDQELLLQHGDAVFVQKGTYTAQRFDDEDFCALLIFLPDDFIKNVLDKYPDAGTAHGERCEEEANAILPLAVDNVLSSYFQSVLSYFPQPTPPPKDLLRIKFEELILNILNSKENTALASCLRKARNSGKVSIRSVMEASFTYNMTMEEFARLCARSLSSFKAEFYEIYRMTPGKWLIEARLHYAKSLIEKSDESINDIADRSGFKNTTHFVRVFKEKYGMPPLQYRLNLQRADSDRANKHRPEIYQPVG